MSLAHPGLSKFWVVFVLLDAAKPCCMNVVAALDSIVLEGRADVGMTERVGRERFPLHNLVLGDELDPLRRAKSTYRAQRVVAFGVGNKGHASVLEHRPVPITRERSDEFRVVVVARLMVVL